jgi:hypothetical protein
MKDMKPQVQRNFITKFLKIQNQEHPKGGKTTLYSNNNKTWIIF